MSTTKRKRIGLAVGLFLVLSVAVFGSLLYVGFTSVNTEVVILDTSMEDDDGSTEASRVPDESIRRGDIEYVPSGFQVESIRRGDIEYVPW